jgi:hypothetical protein
MYLKQKKVKAGELKPGDLYSVDPLASVTRDFEGEANVIPPEGAVGFAYLHVRTDEPIDEKQAEFAVWRIEVFREEAPEADLTVLNEDGPHRHGGPRGHHER